MANRVSFAGQYNAIQFAYGYGEVPPLTVTTGTTATGTGTLTLLSGYISLSDGTNVAVLNTNAPINVGSDSGLDSSITPSAVSNGIQNQVNTASVTGSFTYLHGTGDPVSSATFGLQEAINYASSKGGGTVIIDQAWVLAGGTNTILAAATVPAGVSIIDNRNGMKPELLTQAASGAVSPHKAATYVVTKAGVAALTLAAPTAGTDDGLIITVTSNTAYAHTLTATNLLQTGTTYVSVATFAAHPGAGVVLMAYQGLWNVISATAITFS
jgi:hypothetical protein